jgi:polyhydroxybutyrate depolymerase
VAASPRRLLLSVVGAAVAVGLVVVLALIGLASHKKPLRAAPTTTLAAPNLAAGIVKPQAVTYATSTVNLSYGGLPRSYVLVRPTTTSKTKLPVIVVLHGRDVTPAFESQRTDFTSVVGPSILVYPAGYQESWNAGNCCGAAQAAHVDDIGFVRSVIAQVKSGQPDASPGRVFVAGYSNGGKLALSLACQDPSDFQAVAVYGATDAEACPNRPAADVLVMEGTGDTLVPASNAAPVPEADGYVPPSFLQEVQSYRQADACTDQAVVTTVGAVTLTSWVHCASGARVGEAVFAGQTHDWPVGNASTPSGEGVMWAWFKALGASS